jgi:hypothetical protein
MPGRGGTRSRGVLDKQTRRKAQALAGKCAQLWDLNATLVPTVPKSTRAWLESQVKSISAGDPNLNWLS